MKYKQSKFKLLQYFFLTSLIAFIVTIALLVIFYRYESLKYLQALGEKGNVPIYNQSNVRQIEGVLELYSDVTPLTKQIEKNQRRIVLATSLIFALLYSILFAIVKRANKTINSQKVDLLESQAQYRQEAELKALAAERARATANIIDKIRRFQDIEAIFQATTQELYRKTVINN